MPLHAGGLRARLRRLTPGHLVDAAKARSDDALIVDWVHQGLVRENWGDAIAPLLAERLSGKQVFNLRDLSTTWGRPVYTTIGSMLGTIDAENVVVWGSGFVDSTHEMKIEPARICAVRGPLSRQKLRDSGLSCPDVVGDPALLYPYFYRPKVEKRYQLGLVPHFRDVDLPAVKRLGEQDGVLVINVRGGIEQVADQINSCERIASSSLHALVAGDAYGIPSIWIRLSDRPFGDGFKFRDYLASVGRHAEFDSLFVDEDTPLDAVLAQFVDYKVNIDLAAFAAACPFIDVDAVPADLADLVRSAS